MGISLAAQGQIAEAQHLARCFADRAAVHNNLGQLTESLADYEYALALRPADADLLRAAAWAMVDAPDASQRKVDRAQTLARQVAASEPKSPASWRILGLVQYRAGQWADAVSSINEAVRLLGRRTGPREYLLLAMSHHQLGDSHKARQLFDQAVAAMQDKPSEPDLLRYRNEAAALLGLDEPDAAQDE